LLLKPKGHDMNVLKPHVWEVFVVKGEAAVMDNRPASKGGGCCVPVGGGDAKASSGCCG
jgi:hypothetical protein